MVFLLAALACGALAASAFAHLTLFRWAQRVWPALARYRVAWAIALCLLFLWPLLRLVVRPGSTFLWLRSVAQFGSTWHIFVLLAMAPYGLAALAFAGARRASRSFARARGSALATQIGPVETPAAPPASWRGEAASPDAAASGGEAVSFDAAPPVAGGLSRRRFVEAAGGLGALAASAGVLGWGLKVSRFDWHIDEVPVRLPRLPRALDGFTIVQISDLHVGSLWRERELRQGLGLVEAQRPDLVVVTGDIIDYDRGYVPLAARLLGALKAREGVAFVPGNHDHYSGVRAVVDGLGAAGLDALVNRGRVVAPRDGGGFALIGVDDVTGARRGLGPDLARARAGLPEGLATVLLAHQPEYFYKTLRAGGVDLQLSGHTHGGQVNPGFVPARLVYEFVAGRYERQQSVLYVNRGFGTVGPPMRLGAPPEITKLVLVAG
jgi:uncharacterized protein